MKSPSENQIAAKIVDLLADLLGVLPKDVQLEHVGANGPYDFEISAGKYRFLAEYKPNASTVAVAAAIACLNRDPRTKSTRHQSLVIVPYMGTVGRRLCEEAQTPWLDLCGNARIDIPGLRIWIEGRANQYSERGRPPNLFAPKSSRVARQLLIHPQQFQTQSEMSRETGLGDGYVSKIVRRLAQEQYLETDDAGAVRPRNPNHLLDAWHEVYNFNHHRITKGHVPSRTGIELLQRLADQFGGKSLEWSVTGLGAAWLYTTFAAFRLATVYLSEMPSRELLKAIEFSDEPKGANLWLVLPDDEGVFHGGQMQSGIPCVSAVQTYLDLKGHPERAKDAARELREKCFNW